MIKNIDEYHALFPLDVKKRLDLLRSLIQEGCPEATEKISYGIPTFYFKGNLVHYAGYARHIGFYPSPSAIVEFEKELSGYKRAKGSVQFPHDKELPLELIQRMVSFRVRENLGMP